MALRVFYKAVIAMAVASATLSYAQEDDGTAADRTEVEYKTGTELIIHNPKLAKQNWMLECQGCHKANGIGKGQEMPNMNGQVSKFLSVSGGKEYLSRVNGVADSPLSSEDLVDLMNWMLMEFDPQHIPSDFSGFKIDEVSRLRRTPLDHTILEQRKVLMKAIKAQSQASQNNKN